MGENDFVDPIASNPDWIQNVPEELRSEPSLATIKDFPGLVSQYVNGQKMIGADKVVLPGKEASEETWNEFFAKLGRPGKPEEYGLKKPDGLPEGFPYSEDLQNGFAAAAHKLGLTPVQVNGLYKWYLDGEVEALTGMEKERALTRANTEAELKKEFGSAYAETMEGAKLLVRKFGGDDVVNHFNETGLGDDLILNSFLARVARQFAEDTLKGDGTKVFHTMSPAEAVAEIKRLRMDKDFMNVYMDKRQTGHKEAVEKYQTLYNLAYPEKEKK